MKDSIQISATIKLTTRDKVDKIAKEKKWKFSQCVAYLLEEITKKHK